MPKVSVIIPVYNGEKYIAQAVDSVLNQTYRDFELIVVDDGSTDKTAEILKGYGSKLKYIHQHNQERAAARNTGIRHAQGEYLAFLDADDMWLSHKLEKQVLLMDNDPDVGLVHGWAYVIDDKGQRIKGEDGILQSSESGSSVFESLLFENRIIAPTVMVRKECIRKLGGFDESFVHVEDWDLWLRIAANYQITVINEPLAYYRFNGNSFLEKWRKYDVPSGTIRVVKKACNMLKHRTDLRPLLKQALAYSYWWAATTSHRLGHKNKARKYGFCAFVSDWRFLCDKHKIAMLTEFIMGSSILNVFKIIKP